MFFEAETPTAEHAESMAASPAAESTPQEPSAPQAEAAPVADVKNTSSEVHSETPAETPVAASSDATAADASAAGDSEENPLAMEQLLDQYSAPQNTAVEGEIESGQVVAVTDLGIVVSLGGKTEGLILAQEITEADEPIKLDPGQPIEVVRTGEHKEGYAVLSHLRALKRRAWTNIEKAYREKTELSGKVVDRIKGGLVAVSYTHLARSLWIDGEIDRWPHRHGRRRVSARIRARSRRENRGRLRQHHAHVPGRGQRRSIAATFRVHQVPGNTNAAKRIGRRRRSRVGREVKGVPAS